MSQHEASRTLLKSLPELWSECSDAASLARHLDQFGEIRITRLEPDTTVAWEGEAISGTVRLEPSGWGTRVTLSTDPPPGATAAELPPPATQAGRAHYPESEPPDVPPIPRRGLFARLLALFGARPIELEPVRGGQSELQEPAWMEPEPPPPPEPEPVAAQAHADVAEGTAAVLSAALDSLGTAHHRPFSRA